MTSRAGLTFVNGLGEALDGGGQLDLAGVKDRLLVLRREAGFGVNSATGISAGSQPCERIEISSSARGSDSVM
jgi:hypothetical protein